MIIGYARVSTTDQNLNLQIDALEKYGCELIYQEKVTGTKKDRPQLAELMTILRPGDKVVIYKLDRISRSTKHLIELSEFFEKKGVEFVSIQDSIDTSTPIGRFFFRILASIAELERDIISERTLAGLKSARARGKKGGRPRVPLENVTIALKMYNSKQYSLNEIVKTTNISISSLYRYLEY
ncbi:recombinase family protein [Niallia sp. 03133]|uniref:recombinase family protein n=1 Tax=Niallia sp. 03133 TaxID=3458060 RepID=UPI004044C2FA